MVGHHKRREAGHRGIPQRPAMQLTVDAYAVSGEVTEMDHRTAHRYKNFTIETRTRFAVFANEHHETKVVSAVARPVEGWACVAYHDTFDEEHDDSTDSEIVAMVLESGDSGALRAADERHLFLGLTDPNEDFDPEQWKSMAEAEIRRWHDRVEEARKAREQKAPTSAAS